MMMAPCFDYISGNSLNPCSAYWLATELLSGPKINQTQALALPKLCNVTAPCGCKSTNIDAAEGRDGTSVSSPPTNKSKDTPPAKSPTSCASSFQC
ncbi:hypothetical protein V6N13_050648 [Hibiscus sabdariffa]